MIVDNIPSKIGIVHETDVEYHGGEGVSKSTLWKLETKSPFHARFVKQEHKPQFSFGHAAHTAILEPELLESKVLRGPVDRRGNKWTDAVNYAESIGAEVLTEKDYDLCMTIRDLADTIPELQVLRVGEVFAETSAYVIDEQTGLLKKTRPDIFNNSHGLMADIKNMADVSPAAWERDTGRFGYHMQDPFYRDTWQEATGMEVNAFFFICFEKTEPPLVECYEIIPSAVEEGRARYRRALERYAECEASGIWPGYSEGGIRKSGLRWQEYKLTPAPNRDDREAELVEDEEETEDNGE